MSFPAPSSIRRLLFSVVMPVFMLGLQQAQKTKRPPLKQPFLAFLKEL
jgi:hypothetical protein